jgi:uncharacterized DUF497 family protein
MATVFEGDFEWESAKAASNLVKHGVSFLKQPLSSPILSLCTLMTDREQTAWLSSEPRFESASFS